MQNVLHIIESGAVADERSLSESVRELLEAREPLLAAFVDWANKKRWPIVRPIPLIRITTELSARETTGRLRRLDMQIEFRDANDRKRVIRSEHKWTAMTDPNQLGSYNALPDVTADDRSLCFIACHCDDVKIASYHCDQAATWAFIAQLLANAASEDQLVRNWAAAIIARAPGGARRRFNEAILDPIWEAVTTLAEDRSLARFFPPTIWELRRPLPPHWDRTALYFGLRTNDPFDNTNCRCIYVGFRYHMQNLGIRLQGEFDADLILAVHSNRKTQRFEDHIVRESAAALGRLSTNLRPSVMAPPLRSLGGWHQLSAFAPLDIKRGSRVESLVLADLAARTFSTWLPALRPVIEDLQR